MQGNALVDTCILVYLIDKSEEQKHAKAVQWFKSIKGNENLFVSIQNIREFASIALKKSVLTADEINEMALLFADTFNLIFDDVNDVIAATGLAETNRKNFWDALLVATMHKQGIKCILTENIKHFAKFKTVKSVNPVK